MVWHAGVEYNDHPNDAGRSGRGVRTVRVLHPVAFSRLNWIRRFKQCCCTCGLTTSRRPTGGCRSPPGRTGPHSAEGPRARSDWPDTTKGIVVRNLRL